MINPIELRGVKMSKEYIKPFAWGMAVGMVVLPMNFLGMLAEDLWAYFIKVED